jgi:hypothetical protein
MIIRFTSVEWTWLELEWPPSNSFVTIMSLRMFTTWMKLDCILEDIVIKH